MLKMQNDIMNKGQAKVKLNMNTLKLVTGNQTLLEDHHAHTTKLSWAQLDIPRSIILPLTVLNQDILFCKVLDWKNKQ